MVMERSFAQELEDAVRRAQEKRKETAEQMQEQTRLEHARDGHHAFRDTEIRKPDPWKAEYAHRTWPDIWR